MTVHDSQWRDMVSLLFSLSTPNACQYHSTGSAVYSEYKSKNIPEKEKEKVIEQEVEQSLIQDLSRCQEDELCSKTVGAPNGWKISVFA